IEEVSPDGLLRDRFWNAMGGEDHGRSRIRDFAELLYENRALRLETLYNRAVVDDFVPHINGCAKFFYGEFHDLNGPVDTGAKSSRSGEENLKVWFCRHESPPNAAGSQMPGANPQNRQIWQGRERRSLRLFSPAARLAASAF